MKRDMELVRRILVELEEHEHGKAPPVLSIEDYSEEQIGYHVWMMAQAGLLTAAETIDQDSESPTAIPISITWAGHEFLDVVREPSRWESALKKMAKNGAGIPPKAKAPNEKRKPSPAFMKPFMPSPELAAVVGDKPLPRPQITKKLWAYIKANNLQDAVNRRMINADEKLQAVFGGKSQVSMFQMTALVSKHLS